MAIREFKYRGKTVEELKKMDIKDFIHLVPSRQKRSLKRGFTEPQKKLLLRVRKFKEGKSKKIIKTHCRDMIIVPEMLGLTIHIHRGKNFVPVMMQNEMLGHYLGEFAFTRQEIKHSAPGIGATRSSAAASVK